MSVPRYLAYKDSGIQWVGQVPEHWQVYPLVGIAAERCESNSGMQDDNLLSLSYGRIVRKDIDSNDGLLPDSFETYQVVHQGDVVLRLTDLQNDKRSLRSAQVQERGIITSAYLALRPTGVSPRFLSHLLRAYDTRKVFYSMGGGLRQSMKFSDLKRMPIAVPPVPEQIAITTFLDRETEKIDALVKEQERLVELLNEKRQAVISHAVTKGLDPNVPMKDSGVEWLGEVPLHWIVSPLKHVVTFKSGGTPDKNRHDYWDGDVPWASAKDLKVDSLLDTADHITEIALAEGAATLVDAGTVLVVVRGMILARTFPVVTAKVSMAINQDLKAVTSREPSRNDWLAWILRASSVETLSRLDEAGHGTKVLRMDAWADLPIAVPPSEEQERIASFLLAECERIDRLVSEAERAIALLGERRSALISASVTGKIDVRGIVAQPPLEAA
jgi:type I restriction enzyme S subunit